jgi:hypothetical protein
MCAYRYGHSREVQTHTSLWPTLAHVEVEFPDTVIQVSLQCLVKLKMKVKHLMLNDGSRDFPINNCALARGLWVLCIVIYASN